MTPAHVNSRHDDAAPAKEVECPHCAGKGDVENHFTSTLDPKAVRTIHQRCYLCGGCGKVPSYGGSEQ